MNSTTPVRIGFDLDHKSPNRYVLFRRICAGSNPATILCGGNQTLTLCNGMRMAHGNRGLLLAAAALTAVVVSVSGQPAITSFTPPFGPIGATITIYGTNFIPNASSNFVYFGAVRASVISANSTSIVATVPVGATYAPMTVTAAGRRAYSTVPFILTYNSSQSFASGSFTS